MAYGTFTLTGQHETPTGTPHTGSVVITPNTTIRDTAGDVIMSGAIRVALDETGAWSVVLPCDSAELNPAEGVGYRVGYALRQSALEPQSFYATADMAGSTLDVSDIITVTVPTPLSTVVTPEATSTTAGKVRLAGDLGGTAAAPTVPALATKVETTDPRLSDARTPLAHAHATSDVTGLDAALAAKVDTADARLSDARAPKTETTLGFADLDTIITPGFYLQDVTSRATTAAHYPDAIAGHLYVQAHSSGSFVVQTYTTHDNTVPVMYFRTRVSTTWSPWQTRPTIDMPTAANLDTYVANGVYRVVGFTKASGLTPALPAVATGVLEVAAAGSATVQTWTTIGDPRSVWQRVLNGTWSAWRRLDQDVKPGIVSVSRGAGTTYAGTPAAAYHFRQLLRLNTPAERIRVHLRNYEDRTGTAYTTTLTITGIWIGPAALDSSGELTGYFASAPTQVSDSFTLPADGSDYATVWTSAWKPTPGVDYIISFGWNGPGTGTYIRSHGYGWANAFPAQATQVGTTTNGLTATTLVPLSTRIEVDTDAPRLAVVGDSHAVGASARYPVLESPLNLWAQANGALPVNCGLSGATLADWVTLSAEKWAAYTASKADACVVWLGHNDVFGGTDSLATIQANFRTVVANARSTFGSNLYAATITPRNTTLDAPREAIRVQFNDWLRTLPCRIAGVIDAADAVTNPSTGNTVDTRFIGSDNIHLSTAGCARVAAAFPHLFGRK